MGITAVFDPARTDVLGEIHERTLGLGADVSFECSGNGTTLNTCVDATRSGGTIAQTALHTGPRTVMPYGWTLRDLTIVGTWSFKLYDGPCIAAQVASGRLPVEKIITSRIGIDDLLRKGIEALSDPEGDQVKVLVAP
jgi:(R,R)-butanediol dehydrogenase/meso-butanediol dehydrogenase/diacetyl reductase